LNQALNLARAEVDAAGFPPMVLGLLIAGFIGSLQADQASQGRCFVPLQAQRGLGRIMALFFACMVIVIALQFEGTKDAIDPQAFPSLALLARFGLVGGVDAVGGLLQKEGHQRVGRLEDGGAHQHFQWLDGDPVGVPPLGSGSSTAKFPGLGPGGVLAAGLFFWARLSFGSGLFDQQLRVLLRQLLETMVALDGLLDLADLG
jgi:hypothetical protein